MSDGTLLEIVLLAAVAAFFIFKLRSVLGKRTGHEKRPDFDRFNQPEKGASDSADDKVIKLPDRGKGPPLGEDELFEKADHQVAEEEEEIADSPIAAGITQIKLADRNFNPKDFIAGARAAFEMIIGAFAAGDVKTLRPLLANDVYDDFAGAIQERQKAGQILETTLVGLKETAVIEAEMQGRTAFVTVKFVSEQVNVLRDKDGNIVDGDPNQVTTITDLWTFARNTRSRDPNWTLVATQSRRRRRWRAAGAGRGYRPRRMPPRSSRTRRGRRPGTDPRRSSCPPA